MSEQARTKKVTTQQIMRDADFIRGVDDVRAGRAPAYDDYVGWNYERGRLFGRIAPVSLPINVEGKLNPKAVALLDAAFARGLVL
jgi:hypothetical protein